MEVSLQACDFVRRFMGVPHVNSDGDVKVFAIQILGYLRPRATPGRWSIIVLNPELRARLIALLMWINQNESDLNWSLWFTDLEDELDHYTKKMLGADGFRNLDACTMEEMTQVFTAVFEEAGREVANRMSDGLLCYLGQRRGLVKKIAELAGDS